MFTTLTAFVIGTSGINPSAMAQIFSHRLAVLDRLVIQVEMHAYIAPLDASPLDLSSWGEAFDPGEGTVGQLEIVRPCARLDVFAAGGTDPAVFAFRPSGVILQARGRGSTGKSVYVSFENPPEYDSLPSTPLFQVFDIQVHESYAAGLNIERLLRDPSCRLSGVNENLNTYTADLRLEKDYGTWLEQYEFDLSDNGTPQRFHMTRRAEDGSFTFDREMTTVATLELGGAELISDAVFFTTNSVVDHYGVHRVTVCAASVNPALTKDDVSLVPPKVDSVIWTRGADFSESKVEYGPDGKPIASARPSSDSRRMAAPIAALGGAVAALGLGLATWRTRRGRATTMRDDGVR